MMQLMMKGHLGGVLTNELVGLGSFGIIIESALLSCIILLVGKPWSGWIADQIWLCGGQKVISHWNQYSWGIGLAKEVCYIQ